MSDPTAPSKLPETYAPHSSPARAWRLLEWHARGRLLVHGAEAYRCMHGDGYDLKDVIKAMVEAKILVPCKVDLTGTATFRGGRLALQFKSPKHIAKAPWCTDHATFWTYTPGNPVPMISPHTPTRAQRIEAYERATEQALSVRDACKLLNLSVVPTQVQPHSRAVILDAASIEHAEGTPSMLWEWLRGGK